MTVKLGMTHQQLINAINADFDEIKDQGSKIITKEFPASETETSSVQLDTKCQGKDYMFVFMDYGILEPSQYSLSADGLTVNFSPAIPANHKLLVRYFSYVNLATIPNGLFLGQIIQVPFGIDESKNIGRYLNGQVIIQGQFPAFTAEVKSWVSTRPSLFTTETEWQSIKSSSKLGQCGKFVIDDTAGTIRLPCVVNAQGLVDLALIGGIKSESLPNITASGIFTTATSASGAVYTNDSKVDYQTGDLGTRYTPFNGAFSASRSSPTYQDNAPVQQEAIQYPYCIVVNTGVEEADRPINNYQVNNVYSYGMSQYYKGAMNNNSWLKSAGQWNDGTVYTGMYNWLLEQRNAELKTMYGWHSTTGTAIVFLTLTNTLSVGTEFYGYIPNVKAGTITAISGNNVTGKNDIDNTTSTTAIDVSDPVLIENQYIYDTTKVNIITKSDLDNWRGSINTSDYDFIVNTSDQTFRLPLLNGSEDLSGDTFENITYNGHGSTYTASKNGTFCIIGYGSVADLWLANQTAGTATASEGNTEADSASQCFIDVKKGDIVEAGYYGGNVTKFGISPATGNGSLYYYVGDTLQNAQLINVARIEEKLTDMNAASRGYVVDSYHNGTEWYRIYSDGWIEQSGMVTSNSGTITYNFITPFKDTNYGLLCSQNSGGIGNQSNGMVISKVSNTQFSVLFTENSTGITYTWYACGY